MKWQVYREGRAESVTVAATEAEACKVAAHLSERFRGVVFSVNEPHGREVYQYKNGLPAVTILIST